MNEYKCTVVKKIMSANGPAQPLPGGVEEQFLAQEKIFNKVVNIVEKRLRGKPMDTTGFKLAFCIGTFFGMFCMICLILLIRTYRYRKKRYRG